MELKRVRYDVSKIRHYIRKSCETVNVSAAAEAHFRGPSCLIELKCKATKVADVLAERDATRSRNGEDSNDSGTGVRTLAHEGTYPDFIKCQPLYIKGTEGVVELTQWTVGHDVAYVMTWTNLKKKMTNKYSPRGEIKKLEKLALICARMFPEESDKIERYVDGLSDMIYGSVMASKPKTMQDAIEFATELMDKKISTLTERQAQNKRKLDNNQAQQQPPKKQGIKSGERKEYARTQPLCNKCKFHHNGQCTVKVKELKPWKPSWRYWSTWNGACLRRRRNQSRP
uniref:Reverse transcriptase domain-containing protein n=1 Tax=Tanacetum cinerariifolium TaxID=118510 RepID=A0A6L2JHF9_TANCI|nr:hypothetical protein [Tanacetum cinerariifolium]